MESYALATLVCIFHSKLDYILTGRQSFERGEEVVVPDSEYADDTAVLFTSRESLVTSTPLMIVHFARYGMSIHVGRDEQPVKSEVLFVPAPLHCYVDPETFDRANLKNIVLENGTFMQVVAIFCYLGSMLTRDCRDDTDVARRIEAGGGAFRASTPPPRKCRKKGG